MLRYCNHCKEKSVVRKVCCGALVEYCINKGCGYKRLLRKAKGEKNEHYVKV